MSVIRNKVRPPSLRAPSVPRPRLARRIAQLEEQFGVVWVRGTAGSGKTTAVLEAVESAQRDLAWLTLDSSEAAPGRLLTHLEAALTQTLPDLPPVATESLADGIAHVEAAGLLAEAVGDHELTLVVDELERLAASEPARSTLSSFIRFAPPTLHVILISRRSMQLHLGGAREVGGVGQVTEADLAFSVEEAAHALEALGQAPTDAATAVQATGGWVAGVLFEAWRSPDHMHGSGGEADPLSGYLASEIMRNLSDAEQRFLIDTSVLPEVSAERAEALGLEGETLTALRVHHLPVAFSADGVEMRCHARFREYLQLRLREHDAGAVRELHRRHGELLALEGRHDEALSEFLEARDAEAAERAAEMAIGGVLRRRDFAVAERWLEALRPEAIERSEQLTYAQLVVAMQSEEWVAGAVAADRLRAMLQGSPDPSLAGAIATCYLHVSRMEDAEAVVAHSQPGPEREAWEFILRVAMVDSGVHFRDRPENRDAAVDGYLARLDLLQGRFDRLLDSQAAPWAGARSSRIAALRAVGRLDEALAMFDEWPSAGRSAAMVQLYAELMVDLDRPLDANAALRRSRELIPRSGALSTMLHYLLEATLALRLRRDTVAATEALAKVERDPTARLRLRTLEQIELWRGLIGLLDDDTERAAAHLRYDVALLVETDRLYFLPAAAVYLAEAEWRLGDEAAADAAADRALWAAQRQGSDHLLLQALREFPAVLSRRLDAEAGTDSPWHGLGRTLMSEGLILTAGLRPRVHVREFGTPAIVVDGREEHPKLTRSVEVLAYLAERGGRATRPELLDDLFDGRADDSARSYLRQALRGLREALPADAPLTVDGDDVTWTDEQLTSDSLKARSDIQQALHLRGRARLDALRSPLEVLERGDFLPEARSRWADQRREELRDLTNDARLATAEAAFDLGDLELAEEHVQGVLADDAYRESAWRLSMRLAAALGHDDRVIARFRSCQAALADLSTTPADSTRRLLEQLRR